MKDIDEKQRDLEYWLKQPPSERLRAVTLISMQSLKKGQRMDKSIIHDFVQNKKASGRPQDLADIKEIKKTISGKKTRSAKHK